MKRVQGLTVPGMHAAVRGPVGDRSFAALATLKNSQTYHGSTLEIALPHFTLHHSANPTDLDVGRCLTTVNAALAESGHFEEIDIKSRAFQAEQFLVGVEARGRAFVAGTLSVLTGRNGDARREMGAIALKALVACIPATSELHIQVSVEVVEIQRETYAKAVIAG